MKYKMNYIPIVDANGIVLGVFENIKEAEDAYIEYITCHDNFNPWFTKLKEEFNQITDKFVINDLNDFRNIIFNKNIDDELSFEESEIMRDFWEQHLIDQGNIIREVSTGTKRDADIVDLLAHRQFTHDTVVGNHANSLAYNLLYSLKMPENVIPQMAKIHPLFYIEN